jgi:hypothetical protein
MKLNFRQGIINHPVDIAGTQTFIRKNGSDDRFVDLNCDNGPVSFSCAHMGADYLFQETRSLPQAWGPMVAAGVTQYLYWDISLLDSHITHGFTLYPPYTNLLAPPTPSVDQHWFDMTTHTMKVWNGTKWLPKIRLFAATYNASATVVARPRGSQIGISTGEFNPGNILLGKNSYPLRDADGTFVTSESNLIIAHSSGEDVKFDATLQFGEATQFVPEYSLITFTQPLKFSLASFMNVNFQVNGIVRKDTDIGEIAKVVSNGLVVNPQWNWAPANMGKMLFCGLNGEVTLTPPVVGLHQPVGYVYDTTAIFLNILNPTRL